VHYRGLREALLAAIDGLNDEQLSDPSLDGWSVKDHLQHLALWDDIRASEVVRISAGHESTWRMNDAQDDAYSELGHALRRVLSPAQARWELNASHEKLLEAISAATPRGLDGSLYAEAALRSTHEAEHTTWIRGWRAEQGL
jgi:uncharacterized damage-inducible protein DinB